MGGHRRRLQLLAVCLIDLVAVTACSGGGGQPEKDVPPLGDAEARTAVVAELVAQPQEHSGIARFSVRDSGSKTEGVADFDRQRYVSHLEVEGPQVTASYDVAVIGGKKYEKLLEMKSGRNSPSFEPQWSSPESWAPEKESFPSVPYVPLPFVGQPGSDVRRDVAGFDGARLRQVVDAVITGFTRLGSEHRHGQSAEVPPDL